MKIKRFAILVLILFLPKAVISQSIDTQTRQREKLEKEIQNIDKELSKTRDNIQNRSKILNLTQRKINNRNKIIKDMDAGIANLMATMTEKGKDIVRLERELDELSDSYEYLLERAYLHRHPQWTLYYIFSSDSFSQAWRRLRYFRSYSGYIQERMNHINLTRKRLEDEHKTLSKMRTSQQEARMQRQQEVGKLQSEEKKEQQLIKRMRGDEKQLREKLSAKKKEVERLNKEIKRLLALAVKEREKQKDKGTATAESMALSKNFAQNKGKLPWPLDSWAVEESFGQHRHPVFKNVMLPFNNGVNLSTSPGSSVKAVFGGTVSQVLSVPGYQWCVLLQHGDYFTFYCRLANVSVKSGDKISTGDILGHLGSDSQSGSMHFELWKGMEKQNPEIWLR